MKKIFIYLLFFYINNLYADKNIIDEKISNWYSNLCSSNIEGVLAYILQILHFYLPLQK